MRKFFIFVAIIFGLGLAPLSAAERSQSAEIRIEKSTSAYSKKNKDYWTRVWYEKEAKKGRYHKNKYFKRGKYSKKKRSRRRAKRKRSRSKKSYRSKSAYGGGRVLAKVDLSSQRMNVYQGGRLVHTWKVSTGRKGYGTPAGTWRIKRMHREYYSKYYDNAPMPYAMFYTGGFSVHG